MTTPRQWRLFGERPDDRLPLTGLEQGEAGIIFQRRSRSFPVVCFLAVSPSPDAFGSCPWAKGLIGLGGWTERDFTARINNPIEICQAIEVAVSQSLGSLSAQ